MRLAKRTMVLLLAGLVSAQAWSMEVAKVNGRSITDKDVHSALGGMNEGQRKNVLKDINTRRQIVQSLLEQELVTQEAEKEKLDQDEEYKAAFAQFRKQYLANRLLAKNLSSKVNDSAAKKFFSAHKSMFSTDQVQAQHILVSDEQQAREIMKKAKESNADFQALAEKYSKDPSAKNNRGDLGWFGRDRMVAEFTEAAFSGGKGEIVGPVKTAYGYHVIKVIDKKIGKAPEYDEVELRVKEALKQELIQNYLSGLKAQAKIHVDEKALEKL